MKKFQGRPLTLKVNESKDTQNDTSLTNTRTDPISSPVASFEGKMLAETNIPSEEFPKAKIGKHPSPYNPSPLLQQEIEMGPSPPSRNLNLDWYFKDTNLAEAHAVCELQMSLPRQPFVPRRLGTGFLAKYGEQYAGLFTNNHVLNEKKLDSIKKYELYASLHFRCSDDPESQRIWLDDYLENCFCFTCYILDVTFIKFEEDTIKCLRSNPKIAFLELRELDPITLGTIITVIQRPMDSVHTKIAAGPYIGEFGFDFLHQVSTNSRSSGSPVLFHVGEDINVIGIHKASIASERRNLAVSMQAVLYALNYCIEQYYEPEQFVFICNPKFDECMEELEIAGKRLSIFKAGDNGWPVYPYSDRAIVCRGLSIQMTGIWFIPTKHGWYWTAADHLLPNHAINWMAVTQLTITGGDYNNYTMADDAVLQIMEELPEINYLRSGMG